MEWLVIGISSFLGLISPVGSIADHLLEKQIRQRIHHVDELKVQVTAVPTYQIARGKIDKLQLSAKGLSPIEAVRLEKLEIETDGIVLKSLKKTQLAQPLNFGAHIVLTEADLNQAIASPTIAPKLRDLALEDNRSNRKYDLNNVTIDLQPNRQILVKADLTEKGYPDVLKLELKTTFGINGAKNAIEISSLSATYNNGQPMPKSIVTALRDRLSQRLDFKPLEKRGITTELLQAETTGDSIDLAAIVQVRP
jgi:hypothetical protein